MKITVDFENGMVITTKPEVLQLVNNGEQVVVITRTADGAPVPLFSFNGQIATAEEIAARHKTVVPSVAPATELPTAAPALQPLATATPAPAVATKKTARK